MSSHYHKRFVRRARAAHLARVYQCALVRALATFHASPKGGVLSEGRMLALAQADGLETGLNYGLANGLWPLRNQWVRDATAMLQPEYLRCFSNKHMRACWRVGPTN